MRCVTDADPVSGKPLDTSKLIKLNFFKVRMHFNSGLTAELRGQLP
jgi:hypothetical protein